jgi:hypothetical protein
METRAEAKVITVAEAMSSHPPAPSAMAGRGGARMLSIDYTYHNSVANEALEPQ